jgi:hypothetical protein
MPTPFIMPSGSPVGPAAVRTWLTLLSPNYSEAVLLALNEFGHAVIATPPDWHPRDGPPCDTLPGAVVVDRLAERRAFYLAGFYRGRGVPVVYLGSPKGDTYRRFASVTGAITVHGPQAFRDWLASDPAYLRLKGIP